jgi:hypothetical protein
MAESGSTNEAGRPQTGWRLRLYTVISESNTVPAGCPIPASSA